MMAHPLISRTTGLVLRVVCPEFCHVFLSVAEPGIWNRTDPPATDPGVTENASVCAPLTDAATERWICVVLSMEKIVSPVGMPVPLTTIPTARLVVLVRPVTICDDDVSVPV